jgi:hypothetical protein
MLLLRLQCCVQVLLLLLLLTSASSSTRTAYSIIPRASANAVSRPHSAGLNAPAGCWSVLISHSCFPTHSLTPCAVVCFYCACSAVCRCCCYCCCSPLPRRRRAVRLPPPPCLSQGSAPTHHTGPGTATQLCTDRQASSCCKSGAAVRAAAV